MPPDEGGGKLPDAMIRDFVTWVNMGAPDPREGGGAAAPKTYDTTAARKWWSFQPLIRPVTAPVIDEHWARGEVDRYVLAGLEAKKIRPVGDADKETLIRRVYFDLIGLPPTPAEIDAFVNDPSAGAFEKVVDDLLARPQFGEHWGRHWLDVARYAESSGKEFNVTYPQAWRYRDYVIAAFNRDMPYDQFIREQIAGDLLNASDDKARAQQLVATGFLAVGPKGLDEQVPRQFDLDLADEQVDATSEAFMGLTVSCARCHDHKFDPILQRDYYAMAGIFLSTKTAYGTLALQRNNAPSELISLPADAGMPIVQKDITPEVRDQWAKELEDVTAQYESMLPQRSQRRLAKQNQANDQANAVKQVAQLRQLQARKSELESKLNTYDESGKARAFCMGAEDRPASPGRALPMEAIRMGPKGNPLRRQQSGFEVIADSPLFFRGEMSEPRDRVPRGFPSFLVWNESPLIPRNESGRMELADWIASPRNPLTARVMANRIWSWLFGQGIVASVDNFGTMGEVPSNQALLDYLASQLIDNGWSVKRTIREIVLSRTYRLASTYGERDYTVDPQNALMWRHSKRRLSAECIRDAMLEAGGQLNLKPPVGSAVAVAGDGPIGAGGPGVRVNEDKFSNVVSSNRSVYLPIVRDVVPDSLSVFDFADTSVVTGAREATNVPGQALYLLNSDFVQGQSKLLALRLINAYADGSPAGHAPGPRQQRVNMAFRLVFGRQANQLEQDAAARFFDRVLGDPRIRPVMAWTDFCLALYNTADFRYMN
jgi:hypothetical protein